jgi:hypothetical protein
MENNLQNLQDQNLHMFVIVEPFTLFAQALETNLISFDIRMTRSNAHVLIAVCFSKFIHV